MGEIRIQAVCGFGCGSSLFLRIKIDGVLAANGLKATTFCGDVGTACSADCDVIFISAELAERIKDRAKVPVVVVNNFMDDKEVSEKVLAYFETLK
jgi:PTS system ascorbate-specific IIB component